jgi:flagellar hook-length control protein FliK
MSLSSPITEIVPMASRSTGAASTPRREERGADFDKVLHDTERGFASDIRTRDRRDGRPVKEPRRDQKPERQDQRAEPSPRSRNNEARQDEPAGTSGQHRHEAHKKDTEAAPNNDTAHKVSRHSRQSDAAASEEKPTERPEAVEAAAEKQVVEAVAGSIAVTAAPAAELSDLLLAGEATLVTQQATVEQAAALPPATAPAAAETPMAVAQQLAPHVAVLGAAPVVVAAETAQAQLASAEVKSALTDPVAALATVVTGAAQSGTPGEATDGKKAAVTVADKLEVSQSPALNSARDLARILDQAQQSAQSNPSVTPASSTSPAATVLADAAQAAKAATPQEAMARADAPVPLQAVAVEIGMRAMRGAKEFSIRLDPEDLGRIDVRLEISEAGQVQAKVVVERVETLQLLQRDAKTLERAFDQAGLKTSADGLQFSLRDPGQQARDNNQSGQNGRSPARNDSHGEKVQGDDIATRPVIYRASRNSGLDIRI